MANILLKYLEQRYKHVSSHQVDSPGPVITISRDFGCPANICATDLAEFLLEVEGNEKEPWKVISKEILERASKELGLAPEKIEFIFKFQKRSAVDEVLEALSSKYYKSERKIRNTIKEVIRSIGEQGRVIIVGMAGSVILQDVPKSLHVKLIAPMEFRVEGVSRRHKISKTEARKLIDEMDKKRSLLRSEFAGKRIHNVDYDLIFNCQKLKIENIAGLIAKAAEDREMI